MGIKRVLRELLDRALNRFGYELKDKALPPTGLDGFLAIIKKAGFRPATVLDVGVGEGTSWLYNAFPHAHFELFEALDVFVPAMEKICVQYDARYHVTALGAHAGEAEIDVNLESLTGSTMRGYSAAHSPLARAGRSPEIVRKRVEMRRLDEFGPFKGPVLLKLDVEGFELEVLKGAAETLAQTEILITEASVAQRHENDVRFGTFVSYVESLGFRLIAFPSLTLLRRDGPLCFLDAAFARDGSRYCS